MATASAGIIPSIERWGVLVTNLGAAVVTSLGALYVFLSFFSLPNPPNPSPLTPRLQPATRLPSCFYSHRCSLSTLVFRNVQTY